MHPDYVEMLEEAEALRVAEGFSQSDPDCYVHEWKHSDDVHAFPSRLLITNEEDYLQGRRA